ncbi:MAG: LysE family translocator [Geminicoccaceae bacterium]
MSNAVRIPATTSVRSPAAFAPPSAWSLASCWAISLISPWSLRVWRLSDRSSANSSSSCAFQRRLFLIYWGIALWRKDPNKPPSATVAEPGDAFTSFVTGFRITLGNPKAILFHLGFLPTFFDLPALSLLDAVTIMVIFVVVIGTVLAFYAYAAGKVGALANDPRKMRVLNRCSGTLLIGVGATVLLKRS